MFMLNTNQFLPVALKYFNGISFQLEICSVTSLLTQGYEITFDINNLQPLLSYEFIIKFLLNWLKLVSI
jgi:hypothetical protein